MRRRRAGVPQRSGSPSEPVPSPPDGQDDPARAVSLVGVRPASDPPGHQQRRPAPTPVPWHGELSIAELPTLVTPIRAADPQESAVLRSRRESRSLREARRLLRSEPQSRRARRSRQDHGWLAGPAHLPGSPGFGAFLANPSGTRAATRPPLRYYRCEWHVHNAVAVEPGGEQLRRLGLAGSPPAAPGDAAQR